MDEKYDVIIMGTGMKECILSGLLSVNGKKVLQLDRNDYYGGEGASLNLNQLYRKFQPESSPDEKALGLSKNYCVDLCPKFIMRCGDLVKMLYCTKVTRYLQFKTIHGSFVVKDGTIHKVPARMEEAASSGLMGIFQKYKFKKFLSFVSSYSQSDPSTYQGRDASLCTTGDLFSYWGLDDNTQAFIGHAIALHTNDDYLRDKATDTVEKCQLYINSLLTSQAEVGQSPFIYPVYGLGGLPEGFSRLAAVHGGVFMLNRPIQQVLYDDNGRFCGIRSNGEEARAKVCIADPSYFLDTNKVAKVGKVARWMFFLSHPVPNTGDADSCQIIIPFKHTGRKHDIYITVLSSHHQVSSPGKYVAMVSSVCETNDPRAELDVGRRLLGPSVADFFFETDMFNSNNSNGADDNVFITKSFDPSSHFQQDAVDVMELYERITGTPIDLSKPIDTADDLQD